VANFVNFGSQTAMNEWLNDLVYRIQGYVGTGKPISATTIVRWICGRIVQTWLKAWHGTLLDYTLSNIFRWGHLELCPGSERQPFSNMATTEK